MDITIGPGLKLVEPGNRRRVSRHVAVVESRRNPQAEAICHRRLWFRRQLDDALELEWDDELVGVDELLDVGGEIPWCFLPAF